jgi:hypothetical protein
MCASLVSSPVSKRECEVPLNKTKSSQAPVSRYYCRWFLASEAPGLGDDGVNFVGTISNARGPSGLLVPSTKKRPQLLFGEAWLPGRDDRVTENNGVDKKRYLGFCSV